MVEPQSDEKWQVRLVRPGLPGLERLPDLGLPWLNHPNRAIRPADIVGELRDAMLTREHMLEDVNYLKVVPNRYVVEVSDENYARQFRPIEGQIVQQWRQKLLEDLVTANSRQGRKEFRLGGRLRLEIRPGKELKNNEARILCRIEPDRPGPQQPRSGAGQHPSPAVTPPPAARPYAAPPRIASQPGAPQGRHAGQAAGSAQATRPEPPRTPGGVPPGGAPGAAAYLEMVPSGERWSLYPGINTIGRSESCQVFLDQPIVQEKRLVSGQHAFIAMDRNGCTLYDGSPDGRPSANGTYVNLRRIPTGGYRLQNGDAIVLAAADPLYPRSDTPGVVTFYFWTEPRS